MLHVTFSDTMREADDRKEDPQLSELQPLKTPSRDRQNGGQTVARQEPAPERNCEQLPGWGSIRGNQGVTEDLIRQADRTLGTEDSTGQH